MRLSTFVIYTRNNHITIRAAVADTTDMANAEHFRHATGLATLAAGRPTARLAEICNNLPGARPFTRFTELMAATGWQANSVRGFLSGTLGKKMGLLVESDKAENGERTYSIKA